VSEFLAGQRQHVTAVVDHVVVDVPATDRQQIATDLGVVDQCRRDRLVGADQRGRRTGALELLGQRRPQRAVVQVAALGDRAQPDRADVLRIVTVPALERGLAGV
jgi:hypothetical protein